MNQQIILPLKPYFKPETKEDIIERVRSEDNYTNCKGYPLILNEDIQSRLPEFN